MTVTVRVGASEERALEIVDKIRQGEKVVLEIDPEDDMEGSLAEASRLEREVARKMEL